MNSGWNCSTNLIQAGEQLVNIGSAAPSRRRRTSSEASSMIVRSAAKAVSNTRAKPRRRSAAFSSPATSAPGFRPNSSPRVTATAGACCTTAVTSGLPRAPSTAGADECSLNAPVGQTSRHWPQVTQLDTFSPWSRAGPTVVALPRPMKSRQPTPWTSSHTRTHLPQSTHLAGSRTMAGLLASFWRASLAPK